MNASTTLPVSCDPRTELHEDARLLNAYREGEKWAFTHIYHLHVETVRRFVVHGFTFVSQGKLCRYRGSAAGIDTESVIQETFTRAFFASTRAHYDGERPFKNYLLSIAKNLILREYQRRERVVSADHAEEAVEAIAYQGGQSSDSLSMGSLWGGDEVKNNPEKAVAKEQLTRILSGFVGSLTDEQKLFFEHRFAGGLTQEATASTMGVTRARIKLLEKHMRRDLLQTLRNHGYFVGYNPKPRWSRTQSAQNQSAVPRSEERR